MIWLHDFDDVLPFPERILRHFQACDEFWKWDEFLFYLDVQSACDLKQISSLQVRCFTFCTEEEVSIKSDFSRNWSPMPSIFGWCSWTKAMLLKAEQLLNWNLQWFIRKSPQRNVQYAFTVQVTSIPTLETSFNLNKSNVLIQQTLTLKWQTSMDLNLGPLDLQANRCTYHWATPIPINTVETRIPPHRQTLCDVSSGLLPGSLNLMTAATEPEKE